MIAAVLLVAAVTAGCGTQVTTPGATSPPFGAIPVPTEATQEIGFSEPGYDDGSEFYGFTSRLPPRDTIARYVSELRAAGFESAGTEGAWSLFRGRGLLIAVWVGHDGPPTDLLVRVVGRDLPPGQDPGKTPPGQDPGKTPPGQDPGKTPPGQDPGQTPPGQDPARTPPGQSRSEGTGSGSGGRRP